MFWLLQFNRKKLVSSLSWLVWGHLFVIISCMEDFAACKSQAQRMRLIKDVSQTFAVDVRDGALAEAGVRVQDLLRCLMSQWSHVLIATDTFMHMFFAVRVYLSDLLIFSYIVGFADCKSEAPRIRRKRQSYFSNIRRLHPRGSLSWGWGDACRTS